MSSMELHQFLLWTAEVSSGRDYTKENCRSVGTSAATIRLPLLDLITVTLLFALLSGEWLLGKPPYAENCYYLVDYPAYRKTVNRMLVCRAIARLRNFGRLVSTSLANSFAALPSITWRNLIQKAELDFLQLNFYFAA